MVQTRQWQHPTINIPKPRKPSMTQFQTFPNPNEPRKSTQKTACLRCLFGKITTEQTRAQTNKSFYTFTLHRYPTNKKKSCFKDASPSVIVAKLTKTAKAVKTPTPQLLPLPTPFFLGMSKSSDFSWPFHIYSDFLWAMPPKGWHREDDLSSTLNLIEIDSQNSHIWKELPFPNRGVLSNFLDLYNRLPTMDSFMTVVSIRLYTIVVSMVKFSRTTISCHPAPMKLENPWINPVIISSSIDPGHQWKDSTISPDLQINSYFAGWSCQRPTIAKHPLFSTSFGFRMLFTTRICENSYQIPKIYPSNVGSPQLLLVSG